MAGKLTQQQIETYRREGYCFPVDGIGREQAAAARADLEAYEANVREILERLKKEFAGKVVWVTTTPVNEEWHHANKGFDRFEADVDGYNKIASGIARELGIPIDDLFSAITAGGKDQLLRDDGVHFTEAGSELLGKAVADCIRSMLA